MLLLRKPKNETIQRFLDGQRDFDFTYPHVGSTASDLPGGFVVDHTRTKLGDGEPTFSAAKLAFEEWRQFRLGWMHVWPDDTPIKSGEVVAIVAKSLGLWWLNACRIVYVTNLEPGRKKFGFAYGTLPDHAGSGEERFQIEMDEDGTVWYDILAFSRPRRALARIGYPYMRLVQKQFGKHSATAMQHAVSNMLEDN